MVLYEIAKLLDDAVPKFAVRRARYHARPQLVLHRSLLADKLAYQVKHQLDCLHLKACKAKQLHVKFFSQRCSHGLDYVQDEFIGTREVRIYAKKECG